MSFLAVDPILTNLQFLMETGQELEILNFHKSFPITCKARVEAIERDVAVLKVQPPGSVLLARQKETILLNRGLPEAVRAGIVSFDLPGGILHLRDFSYVETHFGERMVTRVQPEDPIQVEIETDGQHFTGRLADVSLTGVGVFAEDPIPQRGEMLQITLRLPEGPVTLPGKILNISRAPESPPRLSIGFTRSAQEIAAVMRYVKNRRAEILAEIEQMYEQCCRGGSDQEHTKAE